MALIVPERLAAACRETPERSAWLGRLPDTLRELERRWSLTLGTPFGGEEVSCAWVAPVARADGTSAVLKLGMPHMEGDSGTGTRRCGSSKLTTTLVPCSSSAASPGRRYARCRNPSRIS